MCKYIVTSSECYWILNQQLTDTRKWVGPEQGQTSSLKFKKYSVTVGDLLVYYNRK